MKKLISQANNINSGHFCSLFALVVFCFASVAQAAEQSAPATEEISAPATNNNTGDESPMMLYLVPWNANPQSGKNGKKFTLYQPWGSHFDPLTPSQTQGLNVQ